MILATNVVGATIRLSVKGSYFLVIYQVFHVKKLFNMLHEYNINSRYLSRVIFAFILILPGIHTDHTEKWGVPLVMYGG